MQFCELSVGRVLGGERAGHAVGHGRQQTPRLGGAVVGEGGIAGGVRHLGRLAVVIKLVGGLGVVGIGVAVQPAEEVVLASDGSGARGGDGHLSAGGRILGLQLRDLGGTVPSGLDPDLLDPSARVVGGRRGPAGCHVAGHRLGHDGGIAPTVIGVDLTNWQVGRHPVRVVAGNRGRLLRDAGLAGPPRLAVAGGVAAGRVGRVVDGDGRAAVAAVGVDAPRAGDPSGGVVLHAGHGVDAAWPGVGRDDGRLLQAPAGDRAAALRVVSGLRDSSVDIRVVGHFGALRGRRDQVGGGAGRVALVVDVDSVRATDDRGPRGDGGDRTGAVRVRHGRVQLQLDRRPGRLQQVQTVRAVGTGTGQRLSALGRGEGLIAQTQIAEDPLPTGQLPEGEQAVGGLQGPHRVAELVELSGVNARAGDTGRVR